MICQKNGGREYRFLQRPAPFLYFFIALNNCGTASQPKKRPFKQGFLFFIYTQGPCQKTAIILKHQQPRELKPPQGYSFENPEVISTAYFSR